MTSARKGADAAGLFYWVYGAWLVVALLDTASNATTLFGLPLRPLAAASAGLLGLYALIRAFQVRFALVEMAGYFVGFSLGLYSWVASGFVTPLILILFLVAAKGAEPSKVALVTLIGTAIGSALIFASYSLGFANDVVIQRAPGEIDRHSFGFIHPNTLGAVLLNASMAWYMLYSGSTRLRYKLLVGAILVFNGLFLDSRSTALLGTLLILIWIGGRRLSEAICRHAGRSQWVLFLILISSLILTVSFDPRNEVHSWLDSLFSGRFALGKAYIDTYGLGPVGQEIQLGEISDWQLLSQLEGSRGTVDVGYLYLALRAGVIVAVGFIVGLFATFRHFARKGHVAFAICVALVILSGLFETTVFSVQYAFPLLGIGMARWQDGSRTGHPLPQRLSLS